MVPLGLLSEGEKAEIVDIKAQKAITTEKERSTLPCL